MAPGARIVSVKVAGHDGLTTVAQVVAAIDWVVEHRDRDGLNIRVLNLSLGQQGVSDHRGDLMSAAVERAWDAGIFVVVAAGNSGDTQSHLDSPAIDPYVMAVGAVDPLSHRTQMGLEVPDWSAIGDGSRNPTTPPVPVPSPPTGCPAPPSTPPYRRPATAPSCSGGRAPPRPPPRSAGWLRWC